jgi:hypothetical protein
MMINSVFLVPFSSTPQVDALVDAKGGLEFQTPAEQRATLAKVRTLTPVRSPTPPRRSTSSWRLCCTR